MDYLRTSPWTTPTDPSMDHPQIIKKNRKRFTYSLSNRRIVSTKFRALRWVNVTDLGSVSGTSYVIADHYIFAIFCCGFGWKTRKPQKFVPSSFRHFVWPPLSQVQGRVLAFILPLLPQCGNHGWTQEQMNINHFHLVCFSGPSMILDVILRLSNLFIFEIPLGKLWILGQVHAVGEIFIRLILFWGWSVEGSVHWSVGSPWTWSIRGSVDQG